MIKGVTIIWAIAFIGVTSGVNVPNALLGTLQNFLYDLDSSCLTLLYTQEQFDYNRSYVNELIGEVAGNMEDFSVVVTGFTFQRYTQIFNSYPNYMNCKSPTMLILHEDPGTRIQLEKLSRVINMQKMLWIWFERHANASSWLSNVVLPFSCLFVVAQELNASYVALWQAYRVAANYPLHVDYYGFWTQEKHEIPLEIMFNWRNNLEGLLFRTGSTQNAPVHSFERMPNGVYELVGYFPDVWKQLEDILNFTSVHYGSVDNVTGIIENGSWSGLIGMLHNNVIDAAVSEFIMDTQRTHVVEFSRPLLKSSYQLFFKNVGDNMKWDAILRPFDNFTWLSIFVWLIIVSLAMTFVNYCGRKYQWETEDYLGDFTFINSFLFYLKTICFQGHSNVPRKSVVRILFLIGYMVACVLYPSYSASLISYLTNRTPRRPFDNLKSLLNQNTYKLQTNAKTAEYTYFSEARDPALKQIFQQLMSKDLGTYPLNTQDALERVCMDGNLVHFGDMAAAATHLDRVRQFKKCDIITLSKPIGITYSSMAFRLNDPYRHVINHFLQRMEDCGVVNRIYLKAMSRKKFNHQSEKIKVQLVDVAQIFVLLLFGLLLAVIILLLEFMHKRFTDRNVSS